MNSIRVATFQRKPSFDDVRGTAARLLTDLSWCDDHGVRLAAFPECYLQGYALDRQVLARRALAFDSEIFEEILATLAPVRTILVVGMIERRGTGMYNSAAVIRAGRLVGVYSKTHPNEVAFEAGCRYPVFDAVGWPFGINICNDANYPEPALRLSRQGARILCYPLNNMLRRRKANKWRNKSLENLQQRAVETGCWVVSSDVVGRQGQLVSYGCTCIVRPDGQMVERVVEECEGVATFDLS